jgi:hypothetical protein
MRKTLALMIVVGIVVLVGVSRATAGTEECRSAIDDYDSAKGDIADALKKYAACVANSDGQDDCDSEFSNLKDAQDDFESAVSDYQSDCD